VDILGTKIPLSDDVKSSKALASGVGLLMPTFCPNDAAERKSKKQIISTNRPVMSLSNFDKSLMRAMFLFFANDKLQQSPFTSMYYLMILCFYHSETDSRLITIITI